MTAVAAGGTARRWLAVFGATASALLIYAPSLGGPFIADDILYLESNPLLQMSVVEALPRILTRPFFANWSPVHMLMLAAEWNVFGANPLGYRITNVLLHVAAAFALAAVARRAGATRRTSELATVLFLVHPIAVEAVAWINQSKTLLAIVFSLLALERWLAHLASPSGGRVAASLGLALVALLAKPAALPLPFILAVAVFTHGRGDRRKLLWLALLLVPTLGSLAMNLWGQAFEGGVSEGFAGSGEGTARILPWVLWRYLRLVVCPTALAFGVHPTPVPHWLDARFVLPAAAVLAVAALLHRAVRARPCLALAVAWFGFSLIPVLQLVPMDVVYADRYLYFALPGAMAIVAEGLACAVGRAPGRWREALQAAVALAVALLALASAYQARFWADPEALYTRSATRYPLGRTGWTGLGAVRQRNGDLDGAARAYLRSLAVHPVDGHVRHLLARVRLRQKRYGNALYNLEESLRLAPSHFESEWERKTAARLRERGFTPVVDGG